VFPELGPKSRFAVATIWIAGQAALILTGPKRADGAFAFRMFPESSTIEVHLVREVVAQSGHGVEEVPVEKGAWLAHDARGTLHRFRWDDRVKDANLFPYGEPIHAGYGAAAQLDRIAHALDDVATHTAGDDDTVRLIANVVVRKNGGPPERVRFESRYRDGR
jgi:hypothetical protein